MKRFDKQKKTGRRLCACLLGAVMAASLSGCNLGNDVEGLMRPPRTSGEQEAIQTALETYLGSATGYTLKYPQFGEHRSAFILEDLNGDGEDEALAFYQPGPGTRNVHINMLQKADGEWHSISDVEGASNDVEEIRFGDLDADGILEVIVGWNIYNVSDRQLTLYSLVGGTFSKWYDGLYSFMLVTDLTADGRDDLLVLKADETGAGPSATLWSTMQKGSNEAVLSELGTVSLDGTIQSFRTVKTSPLSVATTGVYIDGERTSGGLVTEILYWDGNRLLAPLHDDSTGLTQISYRDVKIPSMDVDGDGQIEWPTCQPFSDTETEGSSEKDIPWKTDWLGWDYESGTASRKFTSVANRRDGYLLRLDDTWADRVTASYDTKEAVLRLYDVESGGKEILALRTRPAVYRTTTATTATSAVPTFSAEPSRTYSVEGEYTPSSPGTGAADSTAGGQGNKSLHDYRLLEEQEDGTRYEVWFSTEEPFNLTMEYIRYMFIYLK